MNTKIIKLYLDGTTFTSSNIIFEKLYELGFGWFLECETENVVLEIKDNILYFKSGIFYWGYWNWGVFENGEFRSGLWKGGIFKGGIFKGEYNSMVIKGGTIKGKKI